MFFLAYRISIMNIYSSYLVVKRRCATYLPQRTRLRPDMKPLTGTLPGITWSGLLPPIPASPPIGASRGPVILRQGAHILAIRNYRALSSWLNTQRPVKTSFIPLRLYSTIGERVAAHNGENAPPTLTPLPYSPILCIQFPSALAKRADPGRER